ncbi:putative uncharacterized protein [Rhodococcus sp. AW25M09]|nr:putative uncharacterized protein [Rhodococcus sp. AW25M09]
MVSASQPAAFGSTPWGKDWVRRVEPLAVTRPNPMLPRARGLVRNDAVVVEHNEIGQFRCVVSAGKKVETVIISLPRFTATEGKSVLCVLAHHPPSGASSGDLPDEVHAELVSRKMAPVPETVDTSCTCSGRVEPCLHATAATYAISLITDQTPAIALAVRGVDVLAATASNTLPPRWRLIDSLDSAAFFG